MRLCKVGVAHAALPAEDQDYLTAWLSGVTGGDDGTPATVMAVALTENGHPVSPTTVKDHRGQRCVCFHGSREQHENG